MVFRYEEFQAKLLNPDLPHQDRQIVGAALVMLKELITNKLRDINRRDRERHHYQ